MDSSPSSADIERVAESLRITHLLDVPFIGLSSGQTRRSRIAASLLTGARMLLLEDPFAGLDVGSRRDIGELLGEVNGSTMRTVLVLRGTGEVGMPRWIDKVANVTPDNEVWTGTREEYLEKVEREGKGKTFASTEVPRTTDESRSTTKTDHKREPIIYMEDVNVAYGDKKVSLC
jgi:energy-coupling factor transporter ATP-binding protein EcfA2